jgi:hypothetical protein
MLRSFARPAHGDSEFVVFTISIMAVVPDSAACYAEQRKALCSALQLFKEIRGL